MLVFESTLKNFTSDTNESKCCGAPAIEVILFLFIKHEFLRPVDLKSYFSMYRFFLKAMCHSPKSL